MREIKLSIVFTIEFIRDLKNSCFFKLWGYMHVRQTNTCISNNTALIHAAYNGHISACEILIKARSSVNASGRW
jgi:hypothetical protein